MNLPEPVRVYVEQQVLGIDGIAFLEFDRKGRLRSWGGSVERHGIAEPGIGRRPAEVAPFLGGMAPSIVDRRLELTRVETTDGHYSDVHFFGSGESDWVVFFDRTDENRGFRVVQQCFNELALLREIFSRESGRGEGSNVPGADGEALEAVTHEIERLLRDLRFGIEDAAFSHILDELRVVIARRISGSAFRIEKCPSWFESLVDGVFSGAAIDMTERFPFLESFFEDAVIVWDGRLPGPVRSGLWIEEDRNGSEIALQATALRHREDAYLLLMFPSIDYREKQQILTRARASELEHEKLRKEIEKKEILLHCIVHDLAGPTHGIQGTLELMAGSGLSTEHLRLVEMCGRQCDAQQRLIRDILGAFAAEVASPDSIEVRAEDAPDAFEVLRTVKEILGSSFETRGVQLEITDRTVEGEERRLTIERDSLVRALINLTENALWHSRRGAKVTLGVEGKGPDIVITVDDRGPGVPDEMRSRLFQKFGRGDQLSRGKVGLGLYFCRITAETWGGEVGQENRPEGGSRFWIRLPRFVPDSNSDLR